jgi:hypothetical protein
MSYNEGIRVGGKHSYDDFGLVFNSREIGYPAKQSIRKTVPFMNGFYDYTKLYGVPAWGERVISYSFDVIGFTVEEMEAERTKIVNWLCNIHDEDIFDDAFPEYHFHGSFDGVSTSEDGEQSTLTFSFVCYPFLIKNTPKVRSLTGNGTLSLLNNGQPVKLKASSTVSCTVTKGDTTYSIPANVPDYEVFTLDGGENNIVVAISGGSVAFSWLEEVL